MRYRGRSRGLSPRGRGKPVPPAPFWWRGRSIPAWAGETHRRSGEAALCGVYPRVGGGNELAQFNIHTNEGLSPRGRGKRAAICVSAASSGSIPAWAGETSAAGAVLVAWTVYPRVGGGNYSLFCIRLPGGGLSPRGRGKHGYEYLCRISQRSIPAWAGETSPSRRPRRGWGVYPRVGGGNAPHI